MTLGSFLSFCLFWSLRCGLFSSLVYIIVLSSSVLTSISILFAWVLFCSRSPLFSVLRGSLLCSFLYALKVEPKLIFAFYPIFFSYLHSFFFRGSLRVSLSLSGFVTVFYLDCAQLTSFFLSASLRRSLLLHLLRNDRCGGWSKHCSPLSSEMYPKLSWSEEA